MVRLRWLWVLTGRETSFTIPTLYCSGCSGWTLNATYIPCINGPHKGILQYWGKLRRNERGKIQFLPYISIFCKSRATRPGKLIDLFIMHSIHLGPLVKMKSKTKDGNRITVLWSDDLQVRKSTNRLQRAPLRRKCSTWPKDVRRVQQNPSMSKKSRSKPKFQQVRLDSLLRHWAEHVVSHQWSMECFYAQFCQATLSTQRGWTTGSTSLPMGCSPTSIPRSRSFLYHPAPGLGWVKKLKVVM